MDSQSQAAADLLHVARVGTPDEMADGAASDMEAKTAPAGAPAPDRRAFTAADANEPEIIDAEHSEVVQGGDAGPDTAETAAAADPAPERTDPVENGAPATEKAENGAEKPELADLFVKTAEKAPESAVEQVEIPSDDVEWGVWEREIYAALTEAKSIDQVTALRRTNQPIMDAAAKVMLERVQEAFAEAIIELTGK